MPEATGSSSRVVEETTETAIYKVKLVVGEPVVVPPDVQAASGLTQIDQGQPVNRHVEIHFYDRSTGEIISHLLPNLRITNAALGTARIIYTEPRSAFLLACVLAVHLPEDGHFGDNFYLPEGVYTFTALVGDEVAVFEDVALSGS